MFAYSLASHVAVGLVMSGNSVLAGFVTTAVHDKFTHRSEGVNFSDALLSPRPASDYHGRPIVTIICEMPT